MRRTLVTLGIATACLLAPAAAANAATTSHHQAKPACATGCTPAPKPPKGGWPCKATATCKPPATPHCPPKKHHHPHPKPVPTPPGSVTPLPPVIHNVPAAHHAKPKAPAKPAARVRLVADTTPTALPQLAMTGVTEGLVLTGLAGGALVFIGAGLIWLPRGFSRNVTGPKHKELSK